MKKKLLQLGAKILVITTIMFAILTIATPVISEKLAQITRPKNLVYVGFAGQVLQTLLPNGTAYAATPDYVVDGDNDDIQGQQALDVLPATGGKVIFFGGNYDFHTAVTRAINNITIEGSGKSTYFARNATDPIFSSGVQTGWEFNSFRTDAGYLGTSIDTRVNNVWNVDIWIGNTAGNSFIIAASDASDNEKAAANWICDGANDELQLNSAFASLETTSSGRIKTVGKTFNLADNVTFDFNYSSWPNDYYGFEFDATGSIFNLAAGKIAFVLQNGASWSKPLIFRGLFIDGQALGTNTGVLLDSINSVDFQNFTAENLTTGVTFAFNGGVLNQQCEDISFNKSIFVHNATAIDFPAQGAARSCDQFFLSRTNFIINTTQTGISIGQNVEVIRSRFIETTMWFTGAAGQVGLSLDGNLLDTDWEIGFEEQATGVPTCIVIGANYMTPAYTGESSQPRITFTTYGDLTTVSNPTWKNIETIKHFQASIKDELPQANLQTKTWEDTTGFSTSFTNGSFTTGWASGTLAITGGGITDKAYLFCATGFYATYSSYTYNWRFYVDAIPTAASQATSTMWIGMLETPAAPTNTQKHAAFKIINGRIWTSCGDGAAQTIHDSGVDVATNAKNTYYIKYNNNYVLFYLNGICIDTIATNRPDSVLLYPSFNLSNSAAVARAWTIFPLTIEPGW